METVLSLAFEKLGQALSLNLSTGATGGTGENGAICPLDGNTDCYIFSLSPAIVSFYVLLAFFCFNKWHLKFSHHVLYKFLVASGGFFRIFLREKNMICHVITHDWRNLYKVLDVTLT